jgi:alpha-D-ribose 1-methylphosphonate 5-triphosphate synthase subunit PhnH
MAQQALAAGFAQPVFDAQTAFRAAMDALARPGIPVPYVPALTPPAPLTPAAAGIAMALLDFEVSFWLAPSLAEGAVGAFLRFHTGASEVSNPAAADFALLDLARDMLDLARFKPGETAYPDRSTTVLALVDSVETGGGLSLAGPGIRAVNPLGVAPLPDDFAPHWQVNGARYPLGVDMLFAAPGAVLGLPRSTRILQGAR